MSHKWIFGTIAAFVLVEVALASGPTHFRANPAFNGTTLAGWHPVGQADWRVEKGEIVGTPRSPAGGWLVLDKAYQDTGFFASFRCMERVQDRRHAPARRELCPGHEGLLRLSQ